MPRATWVLRGVGNVKCALILPSQDFKYVEILPLSSSTFCPYCPTISSHLFPFQVGYLWAVLQCSGVGHLQFRLHFEDKRRRQTEIRGAYLLSLLYEIQSNKPKSDVFHFMIDAAINFPLYSKKNFMSIL